MKTTYEDITSRIAELPKWYDENGTPRYGEFHPNYCPNIYTHQVVLLRIACQACNKQFDVEMHAGWFQEPHPQKLHYGDPPIHGCVGDTMNCEDLAVLQVWWKPDALHEWTRRRAFEGMIDREVQDDEPQ